MNDMNSKEGTFSTKALLLLLFFYLLYSWLYYIAVYTSLGLIEERGILGLFSISGYWRSSGMQYLLFFLGSIIPWSIVFKIMRKSPLYYRIPVLVVVSAVTIYVLRLIQYGVDDSLGWNRLDGAEAVWDLYIPALFFSVQFGVFFGYEHYKEVQRKLKLEGELRQTALKSELAAIKAQLNPHFLYNVFNSINASIPPAQEKTRKMIVELSDMFRYQLMASKKELVPLKAELDFVSKYLSLEKVRFKERMDSSINVNEELFQEKVPPMLLQPLVENAIKHGISKSIKGGNVTISVKKKEKGLSFEISDTGAGVKDKSLLFKKGIGLSNTRLRLEKMYNSTLEITDNHPSGLKVKFSI